MSAAAVVICLSCSLANAEFPKFEYHPIDRIGNQMGQTSLVDIDKDGDGDNDVVRGDVWFENLDGKGLQWSEHAVLTAPGGNRPDRYGLAIKVWVCDLDKDGDQDIVEAEADTVDARAFWFENKGGAKSASGRLAPDWIGHLISADHTEQDFHSLALADFDNDGDIDVCSKPWNGDEHIYLRNMLKENASK